MWITIAAIMPAVATNVYFYGGGVLWQIFIAVVAALVVEALCLYWRRLAVSGDDYGSAILTAVIIGVCLPPFAPWFVAITATTIAITLVKHCYGGLGNNPFNPAMAGYAFVFVCFPAYFNGWLVDGVAWEAIFIGAEATTTPTPLAAERLGQPLVASWQASAFAAAAAIGGIVLLILRIADWRLVVGFLAAGWAVAGDWQALLPGGFVFAAFFVITDPVTAATTSAGRWLYASIVGVLAMWLRNHGAHIDGIAFAVLLGNLLAPLLDRPFRQ